MEKINLLAYELEAINQYQDVIVEQTEQSCGVSIVMRTAVIKGSLQTLQTKKSFNEKSIFEGPGEQNLQQSPKHTTNNYDMSPAFVNT